MARDSKRNVRSRIVLGILHWSARRARKVSTDTKELYLFLAALYPHRAAVVEQQAKESWVDSRGRAWDIFDVKEAAEWA